ncbi:uncharacterized protein V1513DRAFT_445451 [Lipomyces chichibuensis]|uniref:uncharacterized protein n=1 Tax=Lipomyces chichibuensis TaxID=1546026 RepID=UPI003343458A
MLSAEGLVRQASTGIGAEVEPSPSVIKLSEILHSRHRKELIEQIRQDEQKYRQYLREIEEIGRGEWDSRLQDLEIVAIQQNELEEEEGLTGSEKPITEEVRRKHDGHMQPKEIGPEQGTDSVKAIDESANLEDLEMKDIIEGLPAEDLVSKPSGKVPTARTPEPQKETESMEIDSQATIENTQETGTSRSLILSTNPPSESFSTDAAILESESHISQTQNNDSTTVLPNDSTLSMLHDTTDEQPSTPDRFDLVKVSSLDVPELSLTKEEMQMDESGVASIEAKSADVSTEFPDAMLETANVEQPVDIEAEMSQASASANDNAEALIGTSQPLATNVQPVESTDAADIERANREDTERTISPEATEVSETGASRAQSAEPPKAVESTVPRAVDAKVPAMEELEIPDSDGEPEAEAVYAGTVAPVTGGQFIDSAVTVPAEATVDFIAESAAIQRQYEKPGETLVEELGPGDLEATESPAEAVLDACAKTAETLEGEENKELVHEGEEEGEHAAQELQLDTEYAPSPEPRPEPTRKGPGRPRKRGLRKLEAEPGAEGDHEENEGEPDTVQPDNPEAETAEKAVEGDIMGQPEEVVKGEEEQEHVVEEEQGDEAEDGEAEDGVGGLEGETPPRALRGQHKRRYSTANFESSPQIVETKSSPAPSAGLTPRPTNRKFQALVAPLLANISSNRSASFFTNPVNENDAPNYHSLVYEPTDLRTIKGMVKEGRIQNSSELEREIMKMFANAVMYNKWDSDIGEWSREMQRETETLIAVFRGAERRGQNGNTVAPIPEPKRRKK